LPDYAAQPAMCFSRFPLSRVPPGRLHPSWMPKTCLDFRYAATGWVYLFIAHARLNINRKKVRSSARPGFLYAASGFACV